MEYLQTTWNYLRIALVALGGAAGYFWGELDGLLIALLIFTVIDYVTGILCAIVKKELSSKIGGRGIVKKVLVFLIVGIAHTVDAHLIGYGSTMRTVTIIFYMCNEGLSVLENSCRIGLPMPQKLKNILLQLRGDKSNDNGE